MIYFTLSCVLEIHREFSIKVLTYSIFSLLRLEIHGKNFKYLLIRDTDYIGKDTTKFGYINMFAIFFLEFDKSMIHNLC